MHKRYTRLLMLFAKQSLTRDLQFRSNWILSNLTTFSWSLMRLFYYILVFSTIDIVGGWDYARSLTLAATFMIMHALYKLIFEHNFHRVITTIYSGELDPILTKPISSQFTLSVRVMTPRAIIRLALGVSILMFALTKLQSAIPWYHFVFYTFLTINGLIVAYALGFMLLTMAFWVGNVTPLAHVPQVLYSMSYVPYDIFPQPLKAFITWIFPIIFITTIPAKMLFEPKITTMLTAFTVSTILLFLSTLLWKLGLRSYSSVSS